MIARRRCVDQLRQRGRREHRERRVSTERIATPPNVEEAAEATIAGTRVRTALSLLPTDQRTAIELAYFAGLSYRNVAVALGIAEGTAKSRIRLGLSRLARELTGSSQQIGEGEWA